MQRGVPLSPTQAESPPEWSYGHRMDMVIDTINRDMTHMKGFFRYYTFDIRRFQRLCKDWDVEWKDVVQEFEKAGWTVTPYGYDIVYFSVGPV